MKARVLRLGRRSAGRYQSLRRRTQYWAEPITWTADPDKIIRAVRRGHQVLDSVPSFRATTLLFIKGGKT
jgi:hypothetical protein